MARLFTDGAEQGAGQLTTQWTANDNTAPTFVTTAPHSGTYHYRCNTAATQCSVRRDLASPVTSGTYYTRFYWRAATLPNANVTMFLAASSSGNGGVRIFYDNVNAQFQVKNVVSANVAQGTVTITTGVWYRIEVKIVVSDTVGSIEMKYFSGDSLTPLETLAPTGTDTMTTNFSRFYFGSVFTSATGDTYFDDIAINDGNGTFQNGYPGPGKIFTLKANGDNAVAWTKAGSAPAATNWEGVDETPTAAPNDGTDFNGDSGNTNVDRLNLTDLGAEVPSNATIKLVDIYARVACGAAVANGMLLRIWDEAGTPTDGPTITVNGTTWRILSTAEHLVYDTSGKTKANLDSFSAGYVGSGAATDQRRITALWANVEWLEASGTTFTQSITGELTFSGALARQTSKLIAGGLSFAGALSKLTGISFAAALDFTGLLIKQGYVNKDGAVSFAGVLTAQTVFSQNVGGSVNFAGALSKLTQKNLAGSLTFQGQLARMIQKQLSGQLSFGGQLATSFMTSEAMIGSLSFVGNLLTTFIPGTPGGAKRFWLAVYTHLCKVR